MNSPNQSFFHLPGSPFTPPFTPFAARFEYQTPLNSSPYVETFSAAAKSMHEDVNYSLAKYHHASLYWQKRYMAICQQMHDIQSIKALLKVMDRRIQYLEQLMQVSSGYRSCGSLLRFLYRPVQKALNKMYHGIHQVHEHQLR